MILPFDGELAFLHEDEEESEDFGWDTRVAASLIGKYVIAGFVHLEADGRTVRDRQQVHGVIVDAAAETGFVLSLRGTRVGETLVLPPNTCAFVRSGSGEYVLKATGESVMDPDYTSVWMVTAPVLH